VTPEDELKKFIAGINGFAERGHADKVRMFAWLQQHLRKKTRFRTADINWCYNNLSFKSSNTSQFLIDMEGRGELLQDKNGYHCEGKFLAKYDKDYDTHGITLNVRQKVKDLINAVPDIAEKDFMREAGICLLHDAGRATIIMVWNVAFYHLCQFVLKHHLADFNNRIPIRYSKKWKAADMPLIKKYEDFGDEMSEREVAEVCNSAGIVNGNVYKILVGKLDQRNSAAHPSTTHVGQLQAEAFIEDIVDNVVLALKV